MSSLNPLETQKVETKARRATITILGKEEPIYKELAPYRSKSEKICLLATVIGVSTYLINSNFYNDKNIFLLVAVFASFFIGILCLVMVFYKNLSLRLVKMLLCEVNVGIIILCCVGNTIIDIFFPYNEMSVYFSIFLLVCWLMFIFVDAVKQKSRLFVCLLGALAVVLTVHNYIRHFFFNNEPDKRMIDFNGKIIRKTPVKLSIFLQMLTFSAHGVYVMIKDKEMKLMMFCTGHLYRISGETIPPEPQDNSREEQVASSVRALGEDMIIHEGTKTRLKIGEIGGSIFAGVGLILYLLNISIWDTVEITIVTVCCVSIAFSFLLLMYYKNVSYTICKRLWKGELKVVLIIFLAFANFIIDLITTFRGDSTWKQNVLGFVFFLGATAFVFLDALIQKSRTFVVLIGITSLALTARNIVYYTESGDGIALFKFNDAFALYVNSMKRSINVQIACFMISGIMIILKDKKMELMMFGTGHLYRASGSSVEQVEGKSESPYFSWKNIFSRSSGNNINDEEKKRKVSVALTI